ncbi:hypothetical protein MSAN_00604500 [Mycena sanguinolenta]|uniref:DUF6533 domain-containing protein n=1 Tax=Mycena sanguinolenta TaxID=230812 RepID=A0A8H6ZBP1_9AGAR|nr:hypothetical protein MSAN_00604500 [Mycena sanguinolenta]
MPESDSMGGLGYATFSWDHRITRYMFLCGFVILIYDHVLTLGSEVELIWRRLRRPSAIWFLVVRYIPLACSCVMAVFHLGNLSPERCSTMEHVLEALMFLQESLVDITLGLRVLAMYGFDRRVLVSMLIISAISVGLGLWTFIKFGHPGMLTAPALNLNGCDTALPRATAHREARSWEVQLLADTVILGLTAYRAYTDHEIMKLVEGSLIKRMMKDGAMYFGIIVLANLANVLMLYFGDILTAGMLAWWTTSLSVTLIARLGLNLQRAGAPPPTRTEDLDSTELDAIHFEDPRPPQLLEEATVDDPDFELAAERENARVEVA